ncbi:MAG: SUMF1/EgtB/PvdO family nonheme iron enzyme, partial [Planctomycetes bacterium]|nr:SUMF1/EgtB/PvdO family nonheme iron enzyme [Planctomycetota bacterium]
MGEKRKTAARAGLVAIAAMVVAAATWARQETEAGGEAATAKVPEGWEVVDATPGALGFAKKARARGAGITFILGGPGEFQMGSPEGEEGEVGGEFFADDRLQHEVEITKPFYLGETEVTVGQWREFARKTKYRTEAEETGEGGYTAGATGGVELHKDAGWSRPLPQHE